MMLCGDEIEQALGEACRRGHAEVVEFTVAPWRAPCPHSARAYEWLIEFADPPRAPDVFIRALDTALAQSNPEYRIARRRDAVMGEPRVVELPAGTFDRLVRVERRAVPRVAADRTFADAILSSLKVYATVIVL